MDVVDLARESTSDLWHARPTTETCLSGARTSRFAMLSDVDVDVVGGCDDATSDHDADEYNAWRSIVLWPIL